MVSSFFQFEFNHIKCELKNEQKEGKKYRTQVSSVHDLPFMLLLVVLRREIFINHRLLVPSFITTSMAFFNKTISLAIQFFHSEQISDQNY